MSAILKYKLLLLMLTAALPANFSAITKNVAEDKIIGLWISPLKDVIINCFKENGKYYGKIVWFKRYNSNANEDPNGLAEATWMNTMVMKDFVFDENEWNDGVIYDIKSGKKYAAYIKLIDENQLHVTGFILFRFLNKSTYFERYVNGKLPPFR